MSKTPSPRQTECEEAESRSVAALPSGEGALLTRPQLAARWACSTGHLANLASAGRGPTYLKLGGSSVRYRLADIEAYEAAREVLSLEGPARQVGA